MFNSWSLLKQYSDTLHWGLGYSTVSIDTEMSREVTLTLCSKMAEKLYKVEQIVKKRFRKVCICLFRWFFKSVMDVLNAKLVELV